MSPPEKVIVVMGATGSGKSRLSLDLASRFPPSTFEFVNSDKMQLYKGLDVTTNKLDASNLRRFKHHLIGEIEPFHGDVTAAEFRRLASDAISDVVSRGKVPVLVGGSNSFIYALLVDEFDPRFDVFDDDDVIKGEKKRRRRLRYECCFIWVNVAFPVLTSYLSRRLEEMLDEGMFDELAEFHRRKNKEKSGMTSFSGVGKSIGVPEFRRYFEEFPGNNEEEMGGGDSDYRLRRREAYEEAVAEVKRNTWQLAKRQMGKIAKLRKAAGWEMERVDATEAFKAVMMTSDEDDDVEGGGGRERWSEIWEREVVEPSVKIVKRFLLEEE